MTVQIECGWDFEASLLIFKKLTDKSGILREVQSKRFAMTKTQRRREKDLIAARRRRNREARRRLMNEGKRA